MEAASLIMISQQEAMSHAMDVVANNVANSSTSGFKREEVLFDTLIDRPSSDEKLDFAVNRGTFRDISQGPILMTGSPLDLAIQGVGYFPIQTKLGTRYTRGGSFQLNSAGEIVTATGDKLLGDGDQPVTLPEDAEDVTISAAGVITFRSASSTSTAMEQLGNLKLVKFAKEQALQATGNGLYSTTQAPLPDTDSVLVQGAVERSNVQPVKEITQMINLLRSYQMSIHLLDLDNQRQSSAVSRLAKATA
jgi:flagellar basal-body rod protein FlgF